MPRIKNGSVFCFPVMTDRIHACSVNCRVLYGEESFPLEVPLCMILVVLCVDNGNIMVTHF
jgi:hypothetical protein